MHEVENHTPGGLAKTAGMVSGMIFLSRLLGLVREMIVGRFFDRAETDAFFAAFVIPDFMYYLLVGGALSAAFIPLFSSYLAKGEEEEGWRMTSTFLNITVIFLSAFTLLGMVFARQLAPLVAYDFRDEQLRLLVQLIRMMFPAVFFTALAGLMGGILHSYRHFFIPALGPVIYNIGIILGAFYLGRRFGIKGMAVGVVAGAVANFLTQAFYVVKKAGGGYDPSYLNIRHPGFRKILVLMVPALVGLSATQLNNWVTINMASGLAEGSITALRFAQRLILLPLGIFAMAISTVFFPTLARFAARKRWKDFQENLALAIRAIFYITVPAAMGFVVLRYDIIRLLFEYNKFTVRDTEMTAYALLFYSLGLFAHGAIQILPRGFYALKDTVTPVKITGATMALGILLNFFFLKYTGLKHGGLALSFSLMGMVNMVASLLLLRKKIGSIRGRSLLRTLVFSVLSAAGMGIVISFLQKPWGNLLALLNIGGFWLVFLQTMGMIGAGVLVYLALSKLFRMEELEILWQLVLRRKA
ncbi:MAG: murein biosynthesis integral membrane protein MurJ [Firmicutes bacterium]|nr:murein biosynthesis integral membrane protein MurJ [Bacillota bacterium]